MSELHFITDNRIEGLLDLIAQCVSEGIDVVQFRNKYADKLTCFTVGKKISALLKPKKIPFIINDHIDLALALDADGVHIGQTDLPYFHARKIMGKNKIIGLSIQTIEDAEKSEKFDVDYFGVGPIFQTKTKNDVSAMGLITLKKITETLPKPCIAIGGIEINTVQSVLQHGAKGIAVISGICSAENPVLATQAYVEKLKIQHDMVSGSGSRSE